MAYVISVIDGGSDYRLISLSDEVYNSFLADKNETSSEGKIDFEE